MIPYGFRMTVGPFTYLLWAKHHHLPFDTLESRDRRVRVEAIAAGRNLDFQEPRFPAKVP